MAVASSYWLRQNGGFGLFSSIYLGYSSLFLGYFDTILDLQRKHLTKYNPFGNILEYLLNERT